MKIGIYGGSFDPPHKEHINIAKIAVNELGLDKLFVLPAFMPPHKPNVTLADGIDRLNMLNLAFSGCADKIEVCDFELTCGGKSYTYLTIDHFADLYKGAEIYFLVGTDMLENFPQWKNPEDILQKAKLFVIGREGDDLKKAKETFLAAFGSADRLVFSDYTGKNISSTDIRNRLILGLDVTEKLDEKVLSYILENGLYKGGIEAEFVRKNLPISRLTHTLGVMNLAKSYAKRLKQDENKAVFSAMLHDVAKYLDPKDYKDFKPDGDVPKPVVHQFLGAFVSENLLGVKDGDVLNAIRYHTTGRENMSPLEKIVFTADLLEEGRTYPEVDLLRNAVNEDFDKGFVLCVKRLKEHLTGSGDNIYYLTAKCYDYYAK